MPVEMVKKGIRGISYRKYDTTLCTYCARINGMALAAIRRAWNGSSWDKVEVLTGKRMAPTPGMNNTILIGQCMVKAHRNNPLIKEMIPVKGCHPRMEDIHEALQKAGIDVDKRLFDQAESLPGLMMKRYEGRPEFEERLFQVP